MVNNNGTMATSVANNRSNNKQQLFRLSSQSHNPNPVIKVIQSVGGGMNRVSPENRARWNLVKNAVTFTSNNKRKRDDVKREEEDTVEEVIPTLPVPRRRASTRRSSIINLMRENSEEREANDIRRTLNSALHRNSFYQLPGSIFVDEYEPGNNAGTNSTRGGIGSGGSRKYSK